MSFDRYLSLLPHLAQILELFLRESKIGYRKEGRSGDMFKFEVDGPVFIAIHYAMNLQKREETFGFIYNFRDGQTIDISRDERAVARMEPIETFNTFIIDPLAEEFSRRSQCSLTNFQSHPILINEYAITKFLERRPEMLRMANPENYGYLLENFPDVVKPKKIKPFKKVEKLIL